MDPKPIRPRVDFRILAERLCSKVCVRYEGICLQKLFRTSQRGLRSVPPCLQAEAVGCRHSRDAGDTVTVGRFAPVFGPTHPQKRVEKLCSIATLPPVLGSESRLRTMRAEVDRRREDRPIHRLRHTQLDGGRLGDLRSGDWSARGPSSEGLSRFALASHSSLTVNFAVRNPRVCPNTIPSYGRSAEFSFFGV